MFLAETQSFNINNIDWQSILDSVTQWAVTSGVKIALALIIWFISFKIVNFISRRILKNTNKKNLDKTISMVIVSFSRKLIKIVILVALMAYVGIETAGLTALFTTIGLGIGLAVQGSLSNFAGGVLIILTRPFRIGDYIEANGVGGTVENIQLFYTTLVSVDNKVISMPNGGLSNATVTNYSIKDTRRLDMQFSISYEDDFAKAKQLILDCIVATDLYLKDPEPFINIICHNSSSIDIVARVWVEKDNYWTLNFKLLEDVKVAFDEANITIPYPQLDIHQDNK